MTFANHPTILTGSVAVVIACGADEQVRWANARRIVAAMQNLQAFRDWPKHQSPHHTVGVVDAFVFGQAEFAVAVSEPCCLPLPAPSSVCIDLFPKAFSKWPSLTRPTLTLSAAESSPTHLDSTRFGFELVPATFAGANDAAHTLHLADVTNSVFRMARRKLKATTSHNPAEDDWRRNYELLCRPRFA
jgi:hypothetical protein